MQYLGVVWDTSFLKWAFCHKKFLLLIDPERNIQSNSIRKCLALPLHKRAQKLSLVEFHGAVGVEHVAAYRLKRFLQRNRPLLPALLTHCGRTYRAA